jgi:hypothetical protein
VAGSTSSYGNGDFDVVLLRFDQNGSLTLNKTWGGPLLDRSHGMAIDDSFIYVVGDTRSYAVGDEDAFLLKVDANGENIIQEFTLQMLFVLITFTICGCIVIHDLRKKRPRLKTWSVFGNQKENGN